MRRPARRRAQGIWFEISALFAARFVCTVLQFKMAIPGEGPFNLQSRGTASLHGMATGKTNLFVFRTKRTVPVLTVFFLEVFLEHLSVKCIYSELIFTSGFFVDISIFIVSFSNGHKNVGFANVSLFIIFPCNLCIWKYQLVFYKL